MAKRSLPSMAKMARIQARTRFIDSLRRLVFVVFCAAFGFAFVAMAMPHRTKLDEMEKRLEIARKHEMEVLAVRENEITEHRAVQEDPAFMEIHARDRLNLYEEGERVLKFRKEP